MVSTNVKSMKLAQQNFGSYVSVARLAMEQLLH
jgi:hypothetical protein